MGARQKEWARRAKTQLMRWLGGECSICGSVDALSFDCIKPQGSDHHSMDSSRRMSFYRAQARQGNVQLLCQFCNATKSGISGLDYQTAREWVHESAAIQLHSGTPGRGTALSALELRECFRVACSRIRAIRQATELIKEAKNLV